MITRFLTSKIKPSRPQLFGLSYFLPAILAVTAVVIGVVRADFEQREQFRVGQQVKAAEQLAKVASSLETNIHGNVNLIYVGSSRVDLQACKLEYSIVSPK